MAEQPVRILLAKVGLDGHDRGVKVLARALRDAGMEVIYTGLWQTPESTAKAAVEEDPDILGASFHSAAHTTLVPVIKKQLERFGRPDLPLVIGGIIPPGDIKPMLDAGVSAVFEPESSIERIVTECRKIGYAAQEARRARIAAQGDKWLADMKPTDHAALGQVLTWIESGGEGGELPPRLANHERGRTLAIGITGAPGVGKSTLIGQLLRAMRARGKTIATVAVDPVSPITGGSLLGDRARMALTAKDPGVFIRSCASRGTMGGIGPTTDGMLRAIDLAGIDVAVVETVGAGQNDVTIRNVASPVVLVLMPGAGDELQLEKAGIIEIADIFVINKADLDGADRLEAQIKDTLGADRVVVKTVASRGEGIDALCDVLMSERKA
jgi:LAO/AO transport system ATPase